MGQRNSGLRLGFRSAGQGVHASCRECCSSLSGFRSRVGYSVLVARLYARIGGDDAGLLLAGSLALKGDLFSESDDG